jgi:hypothetical protein
MQEASDAIRSCRAGLFLFTKDDPLEAGFCVATRGPRRTIIVREHGAKMPVDLGGIIYLGLADRNDIAPIEKSLRRALERNL